MKTTYLNNSMIIEFDKKDQKDSKHEKLNLTQITEACERRLDSYEVKIHNILSFMNNYVAYLENQN